MNKFIFPFLMLSFSGAIAQKVTLDEVNEPFSAGNVNAYKLFIPYASENDVTKAWKGWLKKKEAKLNDSKGIIFADNTVIKEFGSGTCDIYTKIIEQKGEGITMLVAYDLGDDFLKCINFPDKCSHAKGQLNSFGFLQAKSALEEMIEDENHKLEKYKSKQKSLEKENSSLNEDISDLKSKISKAENELVFTEQSLEKKKEEVLIQKRVVDASSGAVDEQAESAKKIYKKLMSEQNKLEKKQRDLKNDIIDYKDDIVKKENRIKENESAQDKQKGMISDQESTLEKTKNKLKILSEN